MPEFSEAFGPAFEADSVPPQPVTPMPPNELVNRLADLLALADTALTEACAGVSTRTLQIPEPGMDYCCDQGHLFVRLMRIHPTAAPGVDFPQQILQTANCIPTMAAQVQIGVLRCAPTLDTNGKPPTPEQTTALAVGIAEDASIIHRALQGYEPPWANFPVVIESWLPLSSDGGCAGGAWTVWIDVALCPPEGPCP